MAPALYLALALAAFLPASAAPVQEPAPERPTALVVLVPRWPAEGIPADSMPRIRALADEGAWCLETRGEDVAAPAAGWASALTGVHRDRHGVSDGRLDPRRLVGVGDALMRAKEAGLTVRLGMPSPYLLGDLMQRPLAMKRYLEEPKFPYGLTTFDDLEELARGIALRGSGEDLQVVVLDPDDPAELDRLVAALLDGPAPGEGSLGAAGAGDRLVVVHGLRARDGGRFAPLVVNGPGVVRGRTFPAAQTCDVAAIVLHHLGLATDGLDGRPVVYPLDRDGRPLTRSGPGETWMGPAFADFGAELLADDGGDWRRGFAGLPDPRAVDRGADVPEAALVAWDDPGPMTLLAGDALPEPLVGVHGNVFANASTAEPARIVQEVDVLPLRPWFRHDRADVLVGWGAAAVGDAPGAARFVTECLDEAGEVLARSESVAEPGGEAHALTLRGDRFAAPAETRTVRVTLELAPRGPDGYWVADGLTLRVVPRGRVAAAAWRPLLTPETLAEWVPVNVAPETFQPWNGVVRCDGRPTGVLRSPARHRDFVVEFEYLHENPGGNGGFFVWSDPLPAVGVPFTRGIEVQVIEGWETENWTSHGDVFAIWGAKLTPDRPHPAGWMRSLPHQRRAFPAGQWNHFRIVAVDGRIQLWVNGQPVTEGWDVVPREGFLCLESEGAPVRYRNLWVRDLPPAGADPLPPEDRAAPDEGFRSLYSGRDLRGFRPPYPAAWQPQDWKLVAAEAAPWLLTQEEFADFDLILDVRLTGEDAADDTAAPDGAVAVPLDRLGLPGEGFHRLRLRHEDGRWSHVMLDGQELHLVAPLPATPRRGPLALRPPLGAPAEFANLFVRPLAD